MHYKINSKITIKSENAAKPEQQASKYLIEYIRQLEPVASSFDYGCGKLRYCSTITETTDFLVLVDSEIQISREQIIRKRRTSIRKYATKSNSLAAMNVHEFESAKEVYDRGYCINVLSVIPFPSVRRSVLSTIFEKLRPGGTCLFVVQYRNSDFVRMQNMPNARKWRDGFLIDSLRGYSFYGIIPPEKLARLINSIGFQIAHQKLNDGSVYLLAKRPRRISS